MILPNASSAIVSEDKIVEYLLNPMHPDGGPKAIFFLSLGYNIDNWKALADDLFDMALRTPVSSWVESDYGTKYIIEGYITGPNDRVADIRSVWIVDDGNDAPRLVTAYPN